MARLRRLPVPTSTEVSGLVAEWLRAQPSEHTRRRYRRDLGQLAGWLFTHRGRGLLHARPEDVLAFVRTLTGCRLDLNHRVHPVRKHTTIATKATAWSSFYDHCVRQGVLEANPVPRARALDTAAAYPPHRRRPASRLDADALRDLLVEAHRDPWLGGTLGAALVGLLLATHWRPERITTLRLADALEQVDPVIGRTTIRADSDRVPLPDQAREYLRAWIEHERPATGGVGLFPDRSGVRAVSAVDLMRLVNRSAARAGLGDTITASRVARTARGLAHRDIEVRLPTLAQLRHLAPAPEQLALPDDPRDYDSAGLAARQAPIPLPDNVVPLPRRAGRTVGTHHTGQRLP